MRSLRIGFLVVNADGVGGVARTVATQARALVDRGHRVDVVSVLRTADGPHYPLDPRVTTTRLVDVSDPGDPAARGVGADLARELQARPSSLVPRRWEPGWTGLQDVALERWLPDLAVDVLVSTTPGLLAAALRLGHPGAAVVHQEHRSTSERAGGLEPLLALAPRADVVALLSPVAQSWLLEQLGPLAPPTVVVPHPVPHPVAGYRPRSPLTEPLVVAAGRMASERQFARLVGAFARVAEQLPTWRLRICGDGPVRGELLRQQRKWDLWDRVELPGDVADMEAQWAQAAVAVSAARTEGLPLSLQEAMAAGVPTVAFDAPTGVREVVTHDVDGLLVAPGSVSGLAAALLRVAGDLDLRRRLGRAGLEATAAWEPDAVAERWEGVFADAVERRDAGPRPAAPPPRPTPPIPTEPGVTPAGARQRALGAAVDAARAASDRWLVVPAHERGAPVVVLPMTARDVFLAALADADRAGRLPTYLSLRDLAGHGWPERRGRVADLATDLRRGRTGVLALEPWPEVGGHATVIAHDAGAEVEFWESGPDGELVPPRRNPYADRLPADLLEAATVDAAVAGVQVRTLPLLLAPTVAECRFEVDVVVTWVDPTDPAWAAERARRLATAGADASTEEASGEARFRDRGELRWALRSLHLFAPWVRRIHLVTAGQTPDWLDTEHPMIHLVDHREILPADALPTFNSHAIETALHRIEGLAEHFVYLNDDVLLGRPLRKEAFFSPAGQAAVRLSDLPLGLDAEEAETPFAGAAHTNRRLLADAFGVVTTRTLAHVPHPHRVSVVAEVAERFADDVARTASTPFRSSTDVALLSSLVQHHGLVTGAARVADPERHPLVYVNLGRADVARRLRALRHREPSFVCLADQPGQVVPEPRLRELLDEHLGRYLPVVAPWER